MAQAPAAIPFSKVFNDRLDDIERRALTVGSNLTEICRDIGISRSTPDRWRRETPRTIEILEEMEQRVTVKERVSRSAAVAKVRASK